MKPLQMFLEAELLKYLKPSQAERAAWSICDRMINEFRADIINKIKSMSKEEMLKVINADGTSDPDSDSAVIVP